jgi:hypothetical protein
VECSHVNEIVETLSGKAIGYCHINESHVNEVNVNDLSAHQIFSNTTRSYDAGEVVTVEMLNLDKSGLGALRKSMQAVMDVYL